MKSFKTFHSERGFVLLIVYFVVIFVVIYSVVLFGRHRTAILATERYQNRILAFNAAESGIDYALHKLSTQTDYDGDTFTPLTPVNNAARCGYTVTVETTAEYNQRHLSQPTVYPNFVAIPEDPANLIRIIESKGFSPDNVPTSRSYQTSTVMVYCRITTNDTPTALFTHGVYAENSISLSGNSAFDSYNSIAGAYGGTNKSNAGEMAVNSTNRGGISLSGNSKINGNVFVGYGGATNTVVATSGNAAVNGTRSNLSQDWSSPPSVEIPEGAIPITLNVSGNNTVTLTAGVYHASSLTTSGNGKIKTVGAVKIYVDGVIAISGNGVVVPNNRPENLLLYSTGSSAVSISGNGSFYGGVYAPNSAVAASGNGDIFGAVVAKTYAQSGNSATHFDLSLKGIAGPPIEGPKTVHITAWQELNSLAWGTGT